MGRVSEVVKHLIIINIIFFIATNVFGELMYDLFAMHYPKNSTFFLWQPLSHMFMHGDLTHILFNMFGLWMFGTPLEQMWGKQKFIFFYLSAGFGAVLIQTLVYHYDVLVVTQSLIDNGLTKIDINSFFETGRLNTSLIQTIGEEKLASGIQSYKAVMVGASGALYGILVGFAMLFPNMELYMLFFPFPIKAKYLVLGYGIYEVWSELNRMPGDNVAHLAHLGGMLIGYIILRYWKNKNGTYY